MYLNNVKYGLYYIIGQLVLQQNVDFKLYILINLKALFVKRPVIE